MKLDFGKKQSKYLLCFITGQVVITSVVRGGEKKTTTTHTQTRRSVKNKNARVAWKKSARKNWNQSKQVTRKQKSSANLAALLSYHPHCNLGSPRKVEHMCTITMPRGCQVSHMVLKGACFHLPPHSHWYLSFVVHPPMHWTVSEVPKWLWVCFMSVSLLQARLVRKDQMSAWI